ncbi:hypothetical protein [Rhizobium sp. FKY42]|uniref:hypothetical protein n=1 Tax=Rhizobium sp. FKY42 TaxID=2562310 RepID=UPI0010C055B0|nr:hypothetical protein [Rhizobium sp. FKY42]
MKHSLCTSGERSVMFSTLLLLLPLLGFGLGIPSGVRAESVDTIDESLMMIEQVEARLELTSKLVTQVAQTASANGVDNVSDLEVLLQRATASSFNTASMQESIAEALGRRAAVNIDPVAFSTAAKAFAAAAERLREAGKVDDNAFSAQINARLKDQQAGPIIAALAQAMASPELAIETALTGQVMYSALEILTNSTAAELATLPPDALEPQLAEVIEQLRSKISNEKPVPKYVAAAEEKRQISLILAAIPQEDLDPLKTFYLSNEGKAKRDDLVIAYRHVFNAGNENLLNNYLRAILTYAKSQPPSQQN